MSGQVIAVASGKGGVGKTTATVNLGVGIRMTDASVALVDADLGMPNLGSLLSIDAGTTVHDALASEDRVDEAILEQADGFAVVIGDRELASIAGIDPTRIKAVIDRLADEYDYVIVDTGAGMSFESLYPLTIADGIILVTTGEPASVRDAELTADFVRSENVPVLGVIIGQTDGSADASMIADRLGTDLLGTILEDPVVRESTELGKPLAIHAPESAPKAAYEDIARSLVNDEDFFRNTAQPVAD